MSDYATTPLYDWHLAAGAKMMPFGGYNMPLQYTGIVDEHMATRTGCTLFDTCHMGELEVSGPGAVAFLDRMVSCPVATLAEGRCRYGMLCNEQGGVLDDLILYRRGPEAFMVVVNAGTRPGDVAWLREHCPAQGVQIVDRSDETAKIDVQGQTSATLLQSVLPNGLPKGLRYYRFTSTSFAGQELIISRTGYTGELGYECYGPADVLVQLWQACIDAGARPAGLGARDTLRLEAGYPLYGHELGTDRPAHESGFTKAVDLSKEFVGCDALRRTPPRSRLVGLQLAGRRSARAGDALTSPASGQIIGTVTSGSYGPSVGAAIAFGYCTTEEGEPGAVLEVVGARTRLECRVVELPFYLDGTVRADVD